MNESSIETDPLLANFTGELFQEQVFAVLYLKHIMPNIQMNSSLQMEITLTNKANIERKRHSTKLTISCNR